MRGGDECRNGHPFAIYGTTDPASGDRRCRECRKHYLRQWRKSAEVNPETFWRNVSKGDRAECWPWTGRLVKGYGMHMSKQAHRVAWTLTNGEIPAGMQIDHLCRNTVCVNPNHLEPVTGAENMRRRYEIQTHCKNGHEYNEENTRFIPPQEGQPGMRRICRVCQRESQRARQERKRAASVAAA